MCVCRGREGELVEVGWRFFDDNDSRYLPFRFGESRLCVRHKCSNT